MGSINVSEFIIEPFTNPHYSNIELKRAVDIAIRALDTVLDENLENHALPEQKQKSLDYRNVGLGIMGLADALIMLKLRYGSEASCIVAASIMREIMEQAIKTSIELAKEKGAFPKYNACIWDSDFIKYLNLDPEILEEGRKYGLRNCSLLSIAPTGSLATMLNSISGGCEPYFALEYTRTTKSLNGNNDHSYKQYAPIVQEYRKLFPDGPLPDYFVTSENISWKERVEMQSALQIYCDTAISSTVNLPENTPKVDIEQLYLYAWQKGLKGITIFRSGCKRVAILSTEKPKESSTIEPEIPSFLTKEKWDEYRKAGLTLIDTTNGEYPLYYNYVKPVSRKTIGITYGSTFCKKCACGTLYITVNRDSEGNIVEVFTHTSKGGICQANTNAITRMTSMALRSGVKVDEVVDQLKGIKCPACITLKAKGENLDGISCPDILSKTIEEFSKLDHCISPNKEDNKENNRDNYEIHEKSNKTMSCPKCGAELTAQGGCFSCLSCGYSRCE